MKFCYGCLIFLLTFSYIYAVDPQDIDEIEISDQPKIPHLEEPEKNRLSDYAIEEEVTAILASEAYFSIIFIKR